MARFHERLIKYRRVFGARVVALMAISVAAALLVVGVEVAVATSLQLVIWRMGLGAQPALPVVSPFGDSFTVAVTVFTVASLLRVLLAGGMRLGALISDRLLLARLRRIVLGRLLLEEDETLVDTSQLSLVLNDHLPAATTAITNMAYVLSQGLIALGLTGLMVFIHPLLTAATLVFVAMIGLATHASTDRVAKHSKLLTAPRLAVYAGIQRVTRNRFFVRMMRAERLEFSRLVALIRANAAIGIRNHLMNWGAGSLAPVAGVVMISALLVGQHTTQVIPGTEVLLFVYLTMRMVQALAATTGTLGQWAAMGAAFKTTTDILRSTSLATLEKIQTVPASETVRAADGAQAPGLVLDGVSFAHARTVATFTNVAVTVAPGEQLAITGPSGAGKSTLLSIMVGILRPTRGAVTIDGVEPSAYLRAHAERVGYVGSEPFLIKGTIRDNLAYPSDLALDDAAIYAVLEQTRLAETVRRLPDGLDHPLTENGDGLSAGEKQRLALARALLRRPVLLILDEASANVDMETEAQLAEVLRSLKGRCTVVAVSHRPGLIRFADRVLQMNRGADAVVA